MFNAQGSSLLQGKLSSENVEEVWSGKGIIEMNKDVLLPERYLI